MTDNVPGILYEPRAYWDVQALDTANLPIGVPGRVVFDRNNFLNGEPYPVTITRLLFAPISYILREHQNGVPISAATYHAGGAAAFTRSQLRISLPQRQHYNRREILLPSWAATPTWEPNMRGVAGLGYASSLWNVCRWEFEHPLMLPRLGTLEIQLANIDAPNFAGFQDLGEVDFTVGVMEGPLLDHPASPGGRPLFNGNLRQHPRAILRYSDGTADPRLQFVDPNFGGGAFGSPGIPILAPPNQFFSPDTQLSAREYDQQNITQSGSTPVNGFAVQIDQIDYDDQVNNVPLPGNVAGNPIAPLALKTPVRARTTNGGSKAWWWRPWAPLALVCPTITPAQVYQLPVPITLEPGDNMEIQLEVPAPITIDGNDIFPTYTLGVSLTGYAAIEA